MARDMVGANPSGRPRKSSAGKRRQAEKRVRALLAEAAAEYAASGEVRERMDRRDRFLRSA